MNITLLVCKYYCLFSGQLLCNMSAVLSGKASKKDSKKDSAKIKLQTPYPPQVRHVTHHSVDLDWEESLEAAEEVTGAQTGDQRIIVIVQQLSPGITQDWQPVYKYASHYILCIIVCDFFNEIICV